MITIKKLPRVSIVGAGPGDPELITVKGLKAIQTADVIVYDALIDNSLLQEAPQDCIKIYAGKRAGQHSLTQDVINQTILNAAKSNGHVVRLKGGDPFVFGRGHEEKLYLEKHDIRTTVIPGISSSIAVPELEGVPVTLRGIAESFWVITATTKDGNLSNDIKLAAQSSATVVILMGRRKLDQIINMYKALGLDGESIMLVEKGASLQSKSICSTIDQIKDLLLENPISTPCMIVIGPVVKEHPSYMKKALNKIREQKVVVI